MNEIQESIETIQSGFKCLICNKNAQTKNQSGQEICPECQNEFHEITMRFAKKNKARCSICGNKANFDQGVNVCQKCLIVNF